MVLFSQSDLDLIRTEVSNIVKDDSIAVTVTYRMTSGTTAATFDPTTGIIPAMYSESSVSAFKSTISLEEAMGIRFMESERTLEIGDVKFIIMTSDVSGVLSVDDMIRESSSDYQSQTTYQIVTISRDPLNTCYFLGCKMI